MIGRSGFLRTLLALSSASLFGLFAACGGKVVGVTTTTSPQDGGPDNTACGDLEQPVCPVCEGQTPPSPPPQCIDGEWSCPETKCEPPLGCEDTTANCQCGTASCVNDAWVCPATCTDTCPVDISGLAGTACSVEGLICGGEDCANPCDSCNFIGCTGGVWTNEESPPEPCPIDGGSFDGG
jgi:hypothetical protein